MLFKINRMIIFNSLLAHNDNNCISGINLRVVSNPLRFGQYCLTSVPAGVAGQQSTVSHVQLQYGAARAGTWRETGSRGEEKIEIKIGNN